MAYVSPPPSPQALTLAPPSNAQFDSAGETYVSLTVPTPHTVHSSPPIFRERLVASIKKSREEERKQRLQMKMTRREAEAAGRGKKGARDVETASSRRRVRAQQRMYGFEANEMAMGSLVGDDAFASNIALIVRDNKSHIDPWLMENPAISNSLESTNPLPHRQLYVHNGSTQTRSKKQVYVSLKGERRGRKWSSGRPSSSDYSKKVGGFVKDIYNPVAAAVGAAGDGAGGDGALMGRGLGGGAGKEGKKKVRPKSARVGGSGGVGMGIRGKGGLGTNKARPQSARVGRDGGGGRDNFNSAKRRPQSASLRPQSATPKVTYKDFMPKVEMRVVVGGGGAKGGGEEKKEDERQRQAALEYYEKKKDLLSMGIALPAPVEVGAGGVNMEGSQEIILDGDGIVDLGSFGLEVGGGELDLDEGEEQELTDELLEVVDDDDNDKNGGDNDDAGDAVHVHSVNESNVEEFGNHAEFSQWVDEKVDPFIKAIRNEIVKERPRDLKDFTAILIQRLKEKEDVNL
ncbi:hypothetical protein TrVE_jg11807 [Triparma verrucosa]|uniref:Uncharacterized protein n=1 Tax=Triparma verrucosa TaxID=1606542 RepID=A0A9W7KVD3_9STRA|nr:hypothetical protein TrVE_jg11807 [Triparma verrucosa]